MNEDRLPVDDKGFKDDKGRAFMIVGHRTLHAKRPYTGVMVCSYPDGSGAITWNFVDGWPTLRSQVHGNDWTVDVFDPPGYFKRSTHAKLKK
jgi:allantoicase